METSLFIAKIIGVIYTSFGIGLLLNKKYYKSTFAKLIHDSTYTILGGFMAIILGFFILEYHSGSEDDWTVIITVIGWIAIVKGILLIALPRAFGVFKSMFENTKTLNVLTLFVLLFGLLFLYFGFFSNY